MKPTIKVTEDYCRYPGGRYPKDGEGNATDFRKMLVPYLKNNEPVIVDLDDAVGYASSFLDEAFGGLVTREGFSAEDVMRLIEFRATQSHLRVLIGLIERFVLRAKPEIIQSGSN